MEVTAAEPIVEELSIPTEPAAVIGGGGSGGVIDLRTVEELVAKCIAPVKKQFLRPISVRASNNNNGSNDDSVLNASAAASGADNNNGKSAVPVLKEKKSKRQLKRERNQEKKSVLHLCPQVAKTGKVDSCLYKEKCRYSHDVEAYKDQKPADLEGNCPFLGEGPCPYGLSCRYSGTHENNVNSETLEVGKNAEVNVLKKDVQKLLWKNKMKFPKADAQLKLLGLAGPNSKKKQLENNEKDDKTVTNGSDITEENGCTELANGSVHEAECCAEVPEEVENLDEMDEQRPLKKGKTITEGSCDITGITTGENVPEKDLETNVVQGEEVLTTEHISVETDASLKIHPREKKLIDFRDKLYLAPLTTVGNLPFRRVCKVLGADITCGEMAMCTNLLQGQASEWALLRRHSSEDLFGVQICGAYPDTVSRAVELIGQECTVDFIDINMGCPIDLVVNKGAGSALLTKPMRMKNVIQAASNTVDVPITVKVRTGYYEGRNRIDSLIVDIGQWGASAVTIHGRTRQQRYSKLADWDYVYQCTRKAPDSLQVLGNGDIFAYVDWQKHRSDCPELSSCMIARGALIKPWLFTEIKEQRNWDISSGERLNILKDYVRFGLQHWGSDAKGVETTRHFLLEWLSYMYRYVPVGLLEVIPQRLNWRQPSYFGRDDLETLMASDSAADWIRISEILLGKVPEGFSFSPKHKSNSYDKAENG